MRLNTSSTTLATATCARKLACRPVERHLRGIDDPAAGRARATSTSAITAVHRRPGQRHHDLLAGLLRHALHGGDAADRQQRDVGRADAVAARGPDVPELVQHHAGEQHEDEQHARRARPAASPRIHCTRRDPGEQQQERQVHADGGAAEREQFDRPAHEETSFRVQRLSASRRDIGAKRRACDAQACSTDRRRYLKGRASARRRLVGIAVHLGDRYRRRRRGRRCRGGTRRRRRARPRR